MLEAFGQTDVGRRRKLNEDNFLVDTEASLYAVCDGMGGHNAGEVASKMAIETLGAFIRKSHKEKEITWPYGLDVNLSFDGNRIKTAIKLANKKVFKAADNREDYTGMGTTAVAALVSGNLMTVGSAGDSRCYVFAAGKLDAAHARRLLGLGGLGRRDPDRRRDRASPAAQRDHQGGRGQGRHRDRRRRAQALAGRRRHHLLRRPPLDDQRRGDPRGRDAGPSSPRGGGRQLIAAANEAGGKDNVSVVLLRYTE